MDAVDKLKNLYSWAWNIRDDRVDGWLMTSSVKPVLLLLVLYFAIVVYGPRWMRHRQPFTLKWTLFSYNMFVAIYNLHIVKELAAGTWNQGYNWLCEPVQYSKDPQEMRIVAAGHLYFLSKAIELLDTVFIVTRKKNSQLTFLHVYHHSTMLIGCWVLFRWTPGGNVALGALVNAFVHVVMYSYYGLSALGPKVSKYLWWKRYLTIIQLIQFSMGVVIGCHMFLFGCQLTKWLQHLAVYYTLSYLILFGRFYFFAYISKSGKRKVSDGDFAADGAKRWSSSDVRQRREASCAPSSG